MWFFFMGCIFQYGEPLVSHITPKENHEKIDFTPIHDELDEQLVSVSDRFVLARLKQLEQLLIKSKSWDNVAQKDLYIYAEEILGQEKEALRQGKWSGGDIQEIELDVEEITDIEAEIESPILEKAKKLVEEGNREQALTMLEECRDQPCWSEVYVYWADIMDVKLQEDCESITNQDISVVDKKMLLQQLKKDFPLPQHQKYIEKILGQFELVQEAP